MTEIRLDDCGGLDEVVGAATDAHLERMDDGHWFLTIGDVAVSLHAKGPISATWERRHK